MTDKDQEKPKEAPGGKDPPDGKKDLQDGKDPDGDGPGQGRESFHPQLDVSSFRRVKTVLASVAGIALLVVLAFASITRIDASHVGIIVKLTGTREIRGVQDVPVVTGWVLFNPITKQVIEFPISVQNVVWTKSPTEGSSSDDSITFSSIEGVYVNADIGLGFHVDPSLAPHLFLRFYESDLHVIANGYVRNAVREAFNSTASKMTINDIYGKGKSELVQKVTQAVGEKLRSDGFVIDQITINGALRLPPEISDAINKSLAAKEDAIREENRVRQIIAEANQEREKAKGYADALDTRTAADQRAYATLKDLTPLQLQKTSFDLQREAIGKWDGRLPAVVGQGATPFIDIAKLSK